MALMDADKKREEMRKMVKMLDGLIEQDALANSIVICLHRNGDAVIYSTADQNESLIPFIGAMELAKGIFVNNSFNRVGTPV